MLRDQMLAVMEEIGQMVAERTELIRYMAIALLTRKNLFILGGTGQAKSYVIDLFRSHITGAKQFKRTLSKGADEEQLFGRLDLNSLLPGGTPSNVLENDSMYQSLYHEAQTAHQNFVDSPSDESNMAFQDAAIRLSQYRQSLGKLCQNQPSIITAGKIPESHIVFLDEIFKANDGLLNSLLTALNEREYTNEGVTIRIPTISLRPPMRFPTFPIRLRASCGPCTTASSSRSSPSMCRTGIPVLPCWRKSSRRSGTLAAKPSPWMSSIRCRVKCPRSEYPQGSTR